MFVKQIVFKNTITGMFVVMYFVSPQLFSNW